MYAPFFIRFLLSTVTLSLLIVGILLVKRILKKHITAKCQYNIGFIFLIMLSVPFLPIESFNWVNINDWFLSFSQKRNNTANIAVLNNVSNNVFQSSNWLQDFTVSVERSTPDFFNSLLLGIWITGILVMLILTLYCNHRINKIKKCVQPLQDKKTALLFEQCKESIGIHKNIILVKSSLAKTPFTVGFIKPQIILSDNAISQLSSIDLQYILLHELQHCKHKDSLVNYVMCILQIMYWFNPLVWFAIKEMRTDREIACDISVLELLDEDSYIEYGRTLINLAHKVLRSSNLTTVTDMGGTKKQITKRIQKIASFNTESKSKKIKSKIIFILLSILVLVHTPIISIIANDNLKYNFVNNQTVYEDLSSYFEGFQGSFVLYDSQDEQYHIYNKDKSKIRVSPDSTYKIYSSLFGLDAQIITSNNSILEWDGILYPYDTWNKNQDLFSAMKSSVNWYFQSLDSKIGLTNLQAYFNQIQYGNCNLSGGVSEFWMESSLKISPIEQVELLKAFYTNQISFKEDNVQTVKDALLLSEKDGVSLSGKTGTGTVNGKNVNGWFIGYIVKNGNTYFFATNIQNDDDSKGSTAQKITLSILQDKDIYPSN